MGRTVQAGLSSHQLGYIPLPSQQKFHDLQTRFKGFSGPVGSGKSAALCYEALKLSYANTGCHGLMGAPTYQMLRDVTQRALIEILEENDLPYTLNKSEHRLVLGDTGSTILLRSMEDYERLRGINLAWFGLDELSYTSEEAWLRLEARLRDPKANKLCGFGVWTPKGHDWVYKKFLAEPPEGYEAVIAAPFENKFLLEAVPDFYERLKSSYDERFFQQEVLGAYVNMAGGRVFPNFVRGEHVRQLSAEMQSPVMWAVDFNVDPMCSVVVQMSEDTVHVLDEIVISRATTMDACDEFLRRYGSYRAGVVLYGDASGRHQHTTGSTDYQIIREAFRRGYQGRLDQRVPNSNPAVRDRISLTNARLKTADGGVSLFIDPKCRELIKDFEQVVYKEGTTIVDKDKDKKRTHLSDALGYLLCQEFTPRGGERPTRLPL